MTFVALGAMAQVSKDGYFITNDGTRYDGVTIENPDYADACERVMISVRGDGGRFYYPRDIASYGTDFGYRYVSSTVMLNGDTARVFLKELVRDSDISLYEYEGRSGRIFFTIDKETGRYVSVNDDGEAYRSQLRQRAKDCPLLDELDEQPLKMTESSLLSLYEAYTRCSVNDYPGVKWGVAVNAGYSFFNFEDENRYENGIPDRPYAMPGLFVELPIDRRISFRAELYYFFTKTRSNDFNSELDAYAFEYKRHSLVLPLLFKYRFSNLDSKVLPYIELGATFDIKVSGKMDIIENYGGKDTVLPLQAARLAVGPEFGVGLEQKLNERNTLYYGIRGGYYFGGASTDKREFRSNVSINCSISF